MKNYRKIYNRLIKEIKIELDVHETLVEEPYESVYDMTERIENKYGITVLNWVLSLCNEIEGKKCDMILMNEKDFKKWKKNIKN